MNMEIFDTMKALFPFPPVRPRKPDSSVVWVNMYAKKCIEKNLAVLPELLMTG